MSQDNNEYVCLVNEEEQYSLWFSWKQIPLGWRQVGPKGSKEEVLVYIKKVWTDMRSKSIKEQMDQNHSFD